MINIFSIVAKVNINAQTIAHSHGGATMWTKVCTTTLLFKHSSLSVYDFKIIVLELIPGYSERNYIYSLPLYQLGDRQQRINMQRRINTQWGSTMKSPWECIFISIDIRFGVFNVRMIKIIFIWKMAQIQIFSW